LEERGSEIGKERAREKEVVRARKGEEMGKTSGA